jgi:hypothetical protein
MLPRHRPVKTSFATIPTIPGTHDKDTAEVEERHQTAWHASCWIFRMMLRSAALDDTTMSRFAGSPHRDSLYDAQEAKRRLVLFLGDADAILTHAKELARKTEKRVHTLLRADVPKPHRQPDLLEAAAEVPSVSVADV